jgi:hypothetical protein
MHELELLAIPMETTTKRSQIELGHRESPKQLPNAATVRNRRSYLDYNQSKSVEDCALLSYPPSTPG